MSALLNCYYLDEPLSDDELAFATRVLIGPCARFPTEAHGLRQVRVPAVLPLPDAQGRFAQGREERARQMRQNLRHAGVHADAGRRVLWVMPHDSEWDAIFRFAIREETGFGPFVAQRWFDHGTQRVRGGLRVIDTDMLLRGLES